MNQKERISYPLDKPAIALNLRKGRVNRVRYLEFTIDFLVPIQTQPLLALCFSRWWIRLISRPTLICRSAQQKSALRKSIQIQYSSVHTLRWHFGVFDRGFWVFSGKNTEIDKTILLWIGFIVVWCLSRHKIRAIFVIIPVPFRHLASIICVLCKIWFSWKCKIGPDFGNWTIS